MENAMTAVTVSPKFQVVIPKDVREQMKLEPGQQMSVLVYQGRIQLIPLRPMEELRGFASGSEAKFNREDDRL